MKYLRIFLGMLAALAVACAVWLTVRFPGELPIVLSVPEAACTTVEQTMQALCSGDGTGAEKWLYGSPRLGTEIPAEGAVNQMIWRAYRDSLDYRLVGQLYATDRGLAQDVKIISMELPAVTQNLGQRAKLLLQQRVESARDTSEIYDTDHGYRESVVEAVLEEAVRQALEEDVRYTYRIVTLQLVWQEGQWWVVPEDALLNAVFGGFEK